MGVVPTGDDARPTAIRLFINPEHKRLPFERSATLPQGENLHAIAI
jgi:hypothetical protein